MKRWIVVTIAVTMMMVPCGYTSSGDIDRHIPVQQNGQDDIPVIIDVLILRPLGLAACVLGLAASIVAMPFAVPSNSTGKVYRALIAEPFHYTFKRPLGKDSSMGEENGNRPAR